MSEARRTHQIAEHHRDGAALGRSRLRGYWAKRMGCGGFGFRRGRRRSHEARDRPQQSFTIAERHPKLFEVAVGEIGEHVHVDCVVAKGGLVLTEAESAKPNADIHGRAPHGLVG